MIKMNEDLSEIVNICQFGVKAHAMSSIHMLYGRISEAERLNEIGNKYFRMFCEKAGFNPDQPRDDHGRWTSGGGDTLEGGSGNDSLTNGRLSTEGVGNIIFNETRSLSSMNGSDINDARVKIGHAIRNGEDFVDMGLMKTRPSTASDEVNFDRLTSSEQDNYFDSQDAAEQADEERKLSKDDPTLGSEHFFIGGTPTETRKEFGPIKVSTGPFYNSFIYGDVPHKVAYINFSKEH